MPRMHTGPRRTSSRSNRFRPAPQRSTRVVRRTPIEGPDGGTQITTTTTTQRGQRRQVERRTPIPTGGSQYETTMEDLAYPDRRRQQFRVPSPVKAGRSAGGVGLLEAEFIGIEAIIFIELFTNQGTYGDKIMTAMRRGMLTAILFFVLAIVAATGPNAARISKAIGGLVVVAILLTSPVNTMLTSLDNFFKQPWEGSTESGPASSANQSSDSSAGSTFASLPANIQKQLEGEPVFTQYSGILGGAKEAYDFLHSIGSGVLSKLGL